MLFRSDKVAAFVEPPPATEEPFEVEALLTELRRELEHARLGLEIAWTLPAMLPPLLGGQEALLDTLLCTCHALLQLEPSALRLSIEAEPRFDVHRRWFRCLTCGARYISELREDVSVSHDRDGDIVDTGYRCDPAEYDRSLALALACPSPGDPACTCPAHTTQIATIEMAWRVS